MNSRQGDPYSFVATNNVKATFEGCISVTEATWIPHRIRFPEMFNTTTTCIYPFSRRVYRQQVDLDPHYLYYHSWRLGKVLCIKRQKRQSKENTILQRKKINYEKRTGIFWLIIFFTHAHTGGKLDGWEKAWRDWARNWEPGSWSKVTFPQISIQIYQGNKTSIFCVQLIVHPCVSTI